MPYASVKELPLAVRRKLKGKKLRQWMHVWNSSYRRNQSESIAFAEAWAAVHKGEALYSKGAQAVTDFNFFLPISKVDKEKRTVCGYASTPTRDSDGEIVTLEAIKAALPDYMNWRNIREMHALKAVGTAQEANMDGQGLFLTAKIVDDSAWKKCLEGVYKGFSIGGRKLAKDGDKITELEMTEISVVDRPANPDCRITIAKRAKDALEADGYLIKDKPKASAEAKALAKMAKIVGALAKAGPPAARDGFSLPAPVKKEINASPKDDSVENNKAEGDGEKCEKHGVVNCEKCAIEKRDFDAKERREAAASGEAMPDGSFPIKNGEDLDNAIGLAGNSKNPSAARRHIKRRARALGLGHKIPDTWSKNKSAKKLAKAELNKALGLGVPTFLTLERSGTLGKGMRTVGSLSYCFDSLRDAQRSLMVEGQREGGDKKDQELAKQLGSIAKDLAGIISQKATHEAGEAESMSDADDIFVNQMLGDDAMTNKAAGATPSASNHGDPLINAISTMMKAAAQPTRAQRLENAKDCVRKARKAMKECRGAIEEAHKMHKAAFLSKAAKPKGDDGDNEFDHTGAMEKLQKAYGELDKALTFGKGALGQIKKAAGVAGRSGQRGQEVTDAEGKFYEVPPGVKDLSPRDMATASPGGDASGGVPPLYPDDGSVYPGKAAGLGDLAKYAKDGQIPANVVELIMAKAKTEGELEALKRLPAAPSGGRRPYSFDLTKVTAGMGDTPQDLRKSLFEGVDPNALNSGDERQHSAATARVIGNMLTAGTFGKSVLDPTFRGAAGSSR